MFSHFGIITLLVLDDCSLILNRNEVFELSFVTPRFATPVTQKAFIGGGCVLCMSTSMSIRHFQENVHMPQHKKQLYMTLKPPPHP